MSQLDLISVAPELDVSGRIVGSAESDEHYTPRSAFDPWNREFQFTLDVCATAESRKVERFFSITDNGLAQSWAGERVWCNPPYSDIRPWVAKARESIHPAFSPKARAQLVVMLVPAWTDRGWWQEFIESDRDGRGLNLVETRFLKRIRFGTPGDPEGTKSGSPAFWPVLLVWRFKR
jgi:phage N-6-adenine-methyltransferase